jgi:hypothetical protein
VNQLRQLMLEELQRAQLRRHDHSHLSSRCCALQPLLSPAGPGLTHNKFGCPIFATVSSSLRWAMARSAIRFPLPTIKLTICP